MLPDAIQADWHEDFDVQTLQTGLAENADIALFFYLIQFTLSNLPTYQLQLKLAY